MVKILFVIAMAVVCTACASNRSSENDLWKAVKYTEQKR